MAMPRRVTVEGRRAAVDCCCCVRHVNSVPNVVTEDAWYANRVKAGRPAHVGYEIECCRQRKRIQKEN